MIQLEEKKIDVNSEVGSKKNKVTEVNFWGKKVPIYVAKSIFNFFDKNNNGTLCRKEWYALLESYGMEDYEKELAALVDADGGGDISWDEFLKWISRTNYFVHDGSSKADSKFAVLMSLGEKFESYDKDNDGFITIEEFTAVTNDWQYPVDKEAFFKLVDKDNNNGITFNEYYHFFFHPYMKSYYPTVFDDTEMFSRRNL